MAPSPVFLLARDEILSDNAAAYIRVGSLAIAAYDYILTLPAEWRFYKIQRSWRISPGCLMFFLLRYISIATLIVSNVGFFRNFTFAECHRYFLVTPILRAIQTLISQIIMGFRTYNISQRAYWLKWTLPALILLTSSMEFFSNLFYHSLVQSSVGDVIVRNCTGGNITHRASWFFYLIAIVYDVFTISVSSYYLLQSSAGVQRMSGIVRILLYDGLGYFVCLTAVNVVNLILYRVADAETQSSASSLGYAVTWIMSQRILIHLRDAATEVHTYSTHGVTRDLSSTRDISRALRSLVPLNDGKPTTRSRDRLNDEFVLKSPSGQLPDGASDHTGEDLRGELDPKLGVHIQVEHGVKVTYDSSVYDRETYRTNKTAP